MEHKRVGFIPYRGCSFICKNRRKGVLARNQGQTAHFETKEDLRDFRSGRILTTKT